MLIYLSGRRLLFLYPIFASILVGLLIYGISSLYRCEMGLTDGDVYNKILDRSENYKKIVEGFAFSGETDLISMFTPKELDQQTLEFNIKFKDEQIVNQVAVIYINVTHLNDEGRLAEIFDEFYKPQHGINRFKISKKYLPKGCKMMIGFFWKSEWGLVAPPNYEKLTYNISQ